MNVYRISGQKQEAVRRQNNKETAEVTKLMIVLQICLPFKS
jgi:hypothetical protein